MIAVSKRSLHGFPAHLSPLSDKRNYKIRYGSNDHNKYNKTKKFPDYAFIYVFLPVKLPAFPG